MLKACKHSGCAICANIEEREIFKYILKTIHPELYICKKAMYKIINSDGNYFIIPSLDAVEQGNRGYYIKDIYTPYHIQLNRSNVEVVCCCNDSECAIDEPFVAEYN